MTTPPKSEFLKIMKARGFYDDCSDIQQLDEALESGVVTAYIGFDATAKSLHVGSLIQIMMLRWLQRTGHRPIVLMGGGTTQVGDPSFRSDERPLLSKDEIDQNISGIRRVFERFLVFGEGPTDAIMINNSDWLDDLNYLTFLRQIGRHFSINRMLSFESVKSRLDREQSLSFLEFNYMILQSYDFFVLQQKLGCLLQIGGSDQWGNIVNGVDLIRRINNQTVFGLTSPLLTTASGAKMGKTASGAIWLDADLLSPFDFWQFWRNTNDKDVAKFLALFTDIDMAECQQLGQVDDRNDINAAKAILADKVTELTHGVVAARESRQTAEAVFSQGVTGTGIPEMLLDQKDVQGGLTILQALVQTGLADSGKAARRLITGGGVKVNGQQISDASHRIDPKKWDGDSVVLSASRKRHASIRRRR